MLASCSLCVHDTLVTVHEPPAMQNHTLTYRLTTGCVQVPTQPEGCECHVLHPLCAHRGRCTPCEQPRDLISSALLTGTLVSCSWYSNLVSEQPAGADHSLAIQASIVICSTPADSQAWSLL